MLYALHDKIFSQATGKYVLHDKIFSQGIGSYFMEIKNASTLH